MLGHLKLTNVACTVLHSFVSTQTWYFSSAHFRNCVNRCACAKGSRVAAVLRILAFHRRVSDSMRGWSREVWIFLRVLWFSLYENHHFILCDSIWFVSPTMSRREYFMLDIAGILTFKQLSIRSLSSSFVFVVAQLVHEIWIINWGDMILADDGLTLEESVFKSTQFITQISFTSLLPTQLRL